MYGYKVKEKIDPVYSGHGEEISHPKFSEGDYILWSENNDLKAGTILGVYEKGLLIHPDFLFSRAIFRDWDFINENYI